MRFDRQLAAKFESRGFPATTTIVTGDVKEIMAAYAKWLAGVTMGSRIVLTMAKDSTALGAKATGDAADIADLFDAQFADALED